MRFDAYHKWLGIAPKDQPPTLYRLLGIDAFEADDEVIDAAANRLMAWLQEFATGEHVAESQKLLNEIAAARVTLLNPSSKAEYDDQLQRTLSAARAAQQPATSQQAEEPPPEKARRPAGASPPAKKGAKSEPRSSDAGLPSGIHAVRRRPAAPAPARSAKPAATKRRGSSHSGPNAKARSHTGQRLSVPIVAAIGLAALALVFIGGWFLFSKEKKSSSAPKAAQTEIVAAQPKASPPAALVAGPVSPSGLSRTGGVFTGKSKVVLDGRPALSAPATTDAAPAPAKVVDTPASPPVTPAAPPAAAVAPTPKTDDVAAARNQLASTMPAGSKAADVVAAPPATEAKPSRASTASPAPASPATAVAAPVPAAVQPIATDKPAVLAVADHRIAVPGEALQKQAKQQLGKLLGDQSKKSRDAQQRYITELFEKESQVGSDPASLFVLLSEARDSAVQLANLALAETAVDKLVARFQIEALAARIELLEKLQSSKGLPGDVATRCADQALDLVEEAIGNEDFSSAERLARLAKEFAVKARDADLKKEANWRVKEVATLSERWQTAGKARERVAKNENDGEAQLELGRYLCFACDDWEAGLAHLTKGSNDALRQLAAKSLAAMHDPNQLVALGEAWKKQSGQKGGSRDARQDCLAAARHWYGLAEPWLIGLPKIDCKKQLGQLTSPAAKGSYPRRPPPLAVVPFDAAAAVRHQQRWTRYLDTLPTAANSLGMKFVLIPPGEFRMGMDPPEVEAQVKLAGDVGGKTLAESAAPRHSVRITHPFYIGMHEVTVGQFRAFVTASGHKTSAETDGVGGTVYINTRPVRKPEINWQHVGYEQAEDEPVVNVSHADAIKFCQWLSEREAAEYRLPSEAEWEYVCRAGTDTPQPFEDPALLPQYACTGECQTKPVGKKLPNAFGVYDMLGNAAEWAGDWFGYDYYAKSPKDNPTGPETGTRDLRVFRGLMMQNRSAARLHAAANGGQGLLGFRVVRIETSH